MEALETVEFVLLDLLAEDGEYEKRRGVKKYKVIWNPIYCKIVKRQVRLHKEPFVYHGMIGERWRFPFTKEEWDNLDLEYLEAYYRDIKKKYPSVPFLLSDSIKTRLSRKVGGDNLSSRNGRLSLLFLLAFPELFEMTVNQYRLSCRDMHLTVVDSGKNSTFCLLDLFLSHLNYLTILTERPDAFTDLANQAYEDTGLVVEVVGSGVEEDVAGDVVFDLMGDGYSHFKRMSGVRLVYDFAPTAYKHQFIQNKFGKVPIIYNASLSVNGEKVENKMLMEDVLRMCFPLLRILEEEGGTLRYGELYHIKKRLQIEISSWNINNNRNEMGKI